jgi:hypothetical protein
MMPAECRWLKGPFVIKPPTYRQQMTESMAHCLKDSGCAGDEAEARRWLRENGYAMIDIVVCLPDARALVFQDIVAREMSKP